MWTVSYLHIPNYPNCRIWMVWGYCTSHILAGSILFSSQNCWWNPQVSRLNKENCHSVFRVHRIIDPRWFPIRGDQNCQSCWLNHVESWFGLKKYLQTGLIFLCFETKFSQFLHRIFQLRLFQEPLPVDLVPGGSRARPRWAVQSRSHHQNSGFKCWKSDETWFNQIKGRKAE